MTTNLTVLLSLGFAMREGIEGGGRTSSRMSRSGGGDLLKPYESQDAAATRQSQAAPTVTPFDTAGD